MSIIINIAPGHPYSDWRQAEDDINQQLRQHNVQPAEGVCIFLPSLVYPAIDTTSAPDGLQKSSRYALDVDKHFVDSAIHMGDSIGVDQDQGGIGTLGGFLRLRSADDGEDLGVVAVTNYHLVRPMIQSTQLSGKYLSRFSLSVGNMSMSPYIMRISDS